MTKRWKQLSPQTRDSIVGAIALVGLFAEKFFIARGIRETFK